MKLTLAHRKKFREAKIGKFGEQANHWKGGKSIHATGYIMIRSPYHPYKANGYVFEHRLVMEKHIGRYLLPNETIHHLNGIKTDNKIENLVIVTNSSHREYHSKFPSILCTYCRTLIKHPRKNQIYCSEKCNYAHRWNKPISRYH